MKKVRLDCCHFLWQAMFRIVEKKYSNLLRWKSQTISKKPNTANKTVNNNAEKKTGAVDPNQIKPKLKYRKKNDKKNSQHFAICTHVRQRRKKRISRTGDD